MHSFEQIRAVMDKKGYRFSTKGVYNLNLVGVRSKNSQSDSFDDFFHVMYRGEDNRFKHHTFACTTDPGKHWLLNPMNVNGCAIMVPGQYSQVYSLGKHKGEYEALVQTGPIRFVRDNNKDTKLDFSLYNTSEALKKNAFFGIIGANVHRAHPLLKVLGVNKYSAACQVLQEATSLELLITLCRGQIAAGHGAKFSYTLLEEQDFE